MKVKELIAKLQEFPDNLETDLIEVECLIKKLITKDFYKNDIYFKGIAELEISVRSYNCLKNDGILTIGHLIATKESELIKITNYGKKTHNEIKCQLLRLNLAMGQRLPKDLMQALGIERKDNCWTWYISKIEN